MAGRRNLKMLTWNANSIMLSEDGLREAIWRDKYDIVGITETRLSWDDDLIIPDYKVYRSDRDRHGGGVAIIIKQNIEHRRKNLPGLYGIEAVALVVPTRLGEILFVSAYLPPNEPLDEANFHSLINHQYPVVIMGDLNARHTSWRCESSNVNGNMLYFLSGSTEAVILYPNNFTHYPDNDYNPSVIDLFIAVGLEKRRFSRPKARRNLRRMLDSDHVPVEVPVQRVTKYPLLLARLSKATPSVRPDIQDAKKRLKQAQTNIELHLEHMNAEAKDVTSTKLWRRISIIQNGRRSIGEQDMVNIKLRKMAVEVLEWAHEEARFVLEGRLLVAQPTDNNWRRGRTVKLAPVTAMLVTNGKPNAEDLEFNDDSLFPRHIGIKEATLLLVKEKLGRYSLLREPLYLDKCIVCCETDLEDYFEIQELSSKETFIFKAEDGARTKRWCRTLQAHAQSLGAWRKRRGALPNIMICGVARN